MDLQALQEMLNVVSYRRGRNTQFARHCCRITTFGQEAENITLLIGKDWVT